jgi:hypothetical protein
MKNVVKFDDLLWAIGIILMACGKEKAMFWVGLLFALIGIIF